MTDVTEQVDCFETGPFGLSWTAGGADDDANLHLIWSEKAGPVPQLPGIARFGNRVILRATLLELGWKASATYDTPGFVFNLAPPLTNNEERFCI